MAMPSDRRDFIKHAAILSGSVLLANCKTVGSNGSNSGSYLKVSSINKDIPQRVSWSSLSIDDKKAFIDAVKGMAASELQIPATFGTGGERKLNHWAAQAEVHQWYCSHRTSMFLPWHRSYLYNFELCLRKRIRDSFRLPYWDWTVDQTIPIELQDEECLKILSVTRQNKTIAIEGKVGEFKTTDWWKSAFIEIGKGADYDTIGGDADSSGLIESPYHNMVHVGVGGDMGRVPVAAKDPIFWLHHCNVDRLWSLWMDQICSAGNTRLLFPSTDVAKWLDQSFDNHFWTANGVLASTTVKASLFTEELGYNYDTMQKTWTMSDIPPDQATVEIPAQVEKVETALPALPAVPALRLADTPGSSFSLKFSLPMNLFDSPGKLLSLRLKISGIPQPSDGSLSFAANFIIAEKSFVLPEIGFFPGAHDSHSGMIGLSLQKHMNTIRTLARDSRAGQLLLTLKDRNGKAVALQTALPGLSGDASGFKLKWKAVFA